MSCIENQHQNNSRPFRSFTPLLSADISADSRPELNSKIVQSVILYEGWSKSYKTVPTTIQKTVPDLNLAIVPVAVVSLYMFLVFSSPDTPCKLGALLLWKLLFLLLMVAADSPLIKSDDPWHKVGSSQAANHHRMSNFFSLLPFEVHEGIVNWHQSVVTKTPLTHVVLLMAQCQMDSFLWQLLLTHFAHAWLWCTQCMCTMNSLGTFWSTLVI